MLLSQFLLTLVTDHTVTNPYCICKQVVYGKKRGAAAKNKYEGHADLLAPKVKELQELEKSAQTSFLMLTHHYHKLLKSHT